MVCGCFLRKTGLFSCLDMNTKKYALPQEHDHSVQKKFFCVICIILPLGRRVKPFVKKDIKIYSVV